MLSSKPTGEVVQTDTKMSASLQPWAAIWPVETIQVAMPFGIIEETILAPGPVPYDTTVTVSGSPY